MRRCHIRSWVPALEGPYCIQESVTTLWNTAHQCVRKVRDWNVWALKIHIQDFASSAMTNSSTKAFGTGVCIVCLQHNGKYSPLSYFFHFECMEEATSFCPAYNFQPLVALLVQQFKPIQNLFYLWLDSNFQCQIDSVSVTFLFDLIK